MTTLPHKTLSLFSTIKMYNNLQKINNQNSFHKHTGSLWCSLNAEIVADDNITLLKQLALNWALEKKRQMLAYEILYIDSYAFNIIPHIYCTVQGFQRLPGTFDMI